MPDFPTDHREDWEAKVTALLLGELPPEEAEAVRRQIAQDPALVEWKQQLQLTMGLVRGSLQTPAESTSPQTPPLRLSEPKREQLLAHFKTVKVKQPQIAPSCDDEKSWVNWLAAAAAVALLTAISIPNFVRSRSASQQNAIINNLRLLDAATEQWALEKGKSATATPTMQDIQPYFGHGAHGEIASVSGETYILGPVGKAPVAVTKNGVVRLPGDDGDVASASIPAKQATATLGFKEAPESRREAVTAGTIMTANKDLSALATAAAPPPPAAAPPQEIAAYDFSGANPSAVSGAANELFYKTPENGAAPSSQPVSPLHRRFAPQLGDTPIAGRASAASQSGSGGGFGGIVLAKNDRGNQPAMELPPPSIPAQAPTPVDDSQPESVALRPSATPTGTTESDLIARLDARQKIRAQSGQEGIADKKAEAADSAPPQSLNAVGYINVTTNSVAIVTDKVEQLDKAKRAPALSPTPQPEVKTSDNPFSTFSLNVSDASFRLAAATLEKGQMPEPGRIRSEEFLNAFDYREPEPAPGVKVSFAWDRCADPFTHNRDFLRFSLKTAAEGREASRPLNLVLLLDKSGSMERADRVVIIRKMLDTLAAQLHPSDTISVVVFARTARLWADGIAGDKAADTLKSVGDTTPEGGTDIEEAMRIAYQTAARHYQPAGENRVVLLTDGAANLGDVDPVSLKKNVETNRAQGTAFDCFGVGWEGYNDELLETLARAGGGRYGFINTPEEAVTEFAGQLAGALRVAAYDVKTQVEFNPNRVTLWRQIGYAKDQLTKEQFRDNSVKAAQLGAAESGNALYVIQVNPQGDGPLATVRVRYRLPESNEYREQEWPVPYTGTSTTLENSNPAMRLAATASVFSEWLQSSPYAGEVKLDNLQRDLNGVPQTYGADTRPELLGTMIQEARSISGK